MKDADIHGCVDTSVRIICLLTKLSFVFVSIHTLRFNIYICCFFNENRSSEIHSFSTCGFIETQMRESYWLYQVFL